MAEQKDSIKNSPPLLGRYKLLKEKQRSAVYRSFLAYDLRLKRGVVVKLIPVHGFQKKNLPILWQFLEKVSKEEQYISRIVELDFQYDSILVVEEYLEGRYFNSPIFEDPHDYERFETILYRTVELVKRIHTNRIPHGFIDFRNIKVTPNDAVILEDYPVLYWLENNRFLMPESIPDKQLKPEIRDLRQLGLILFNVYRTQLVPEFHAFPESYTRKAIYDFFKTQSFAHFSDLERVLARLLLAGDLPKGYQSIIEVYNDVRDLVGTIPSPVKIREKVSPLAKIEKKIHETKPDQLTGSSPETKELAMKLGKPVSQVPQVEIPPEKPFEKTTEKMPEVYSKRELNREQFVFRISAWVTLLVFSIMLFSVVMILTKGFLTRSVPEVTIPELNGLSFDEAMSKTTRLGLKLTINLEEYSEELPKGMIINHQPPAGTRAKKGRTIYAIVSKGLASVEVPNVIDMPEDAATNHLSRFQLSVGKKEYVSNEDVPYGIVIDQNPPAKEKVATGEKVDLTISSGVLKKQFIMPDLKTLTLSEALNALDQKDLEVRSIKRNYSPYYEKDTITVQNPLAGDQAQSGMYVDLEVVLPIRQRPAEQFKINLRISLPDFEGRKYVKIINKNQKNTTTVHNSLHAGKDEIFLSTDGVGYTSISVFLENELIREETF